MFSAPIPGQSLTSEPKNAAWENPPEFPAAEDALLWHMKRLSEPKKIKSALGLLELGLDVVTLTEGILRGAVIEGRHSIDVSLVIGPVIHEYISGSADAAGIEYNEGLEEELSDEDFNYSIEEAKANKIIDEYKESGEISMAMPEPEEAPEEVPAEEMAEEKPAGLMARGVA